MVYYCHDCERRFRLQNDYHNHLRASPNHNWCGACNIDFDTYSGLDDHINNDQDHLDNIYDWVCYDHWEGFDSEEELQTHWTDHHSYCRPCNEHFADARSLLKHDVEEHFYCKICERFFNSANGLQNHSAAKHDYCSPCGTVFSSRKQLVQHDNQQHLYCTECQRQFSSRSNIDAHMRSTLHAGRTILCPFGCGGFPTESALVLHFEHGTCNSGLDRKKIDNRMRQLDRNHIITNKLLDYTHDSDIGPIANGQSWNGQFFECYLCPKEFKTLNSLNQHLNSPAHAAKLYKCPGQACRQNFGQLSGLWQHLESGSCESGSAIRRSIMRRFSQSVSGTRMIQG